MGHCPECGKDIAELVQSYMGTTMVNGAEADVFVWECPECGAILGTSDSVL